MIIGIDPGFGRVGYAILAGTSEPRVLDLGHISTAQKTAFPNRLLEIRVSLMELLDRHNPEEAAIENIYFGRNVTTGINVAQARGVMLMTLAERGVRIFEYAPNQVKKSVTGRGRASKAEMSLMVQRLLSLKEKVKQDDANDALAMALAHWNRSHGSIIGNRL